MMALTSRLAAKHPAEKFTPDLEIDEGFDLSSYGFDGRILHIPGHSKGSIGVLTAKGDLFCGDLFYNMPGFRFVDN
jgi:glyoxylase-like metal-dependent hydrolase (beta-lactamase superfamily II)